MVAQTLNSCSAFKLSKVHTHSSEHTHTVNTHTRSSGQPFYAAAPGEQLGFGDLLKGLTSVVVLRVERALHIHFPTIPAARDSNPQPFDYKSDSLNIRPHNNYSIINISDLVASPTNIFFPT